jgi:putative ABC transport system permease protein
MAARIATTFTSLLGGIAGVSLIIGGIGIMNIMLVSVTQRTREIGVRKAIGAKDRDILRQFVIEALVISAVGGLIGLLLGVAASALIPRITNFSTHVEPWSILLALISSSAVGVFFGYYPARNAARMDPIDALRSE